MAEAKWYVVHTYSGYENKVKANIEKTIENNKNLAEQILEVRVPMQDVMELKDLKPGMLLTGTVRNVIDFGVFVDIGVHQDGLVHISQVTDQFIRHPSQVVRVGDVVQVAVLEVDPKRGRICLTMRNLPKEAKA